MRPQKDVIKTLERAALDGHRAAQSWRDFFGGNVAEISGIIRSDPAAWSALRDRLLSLLVSGDTSGQRAAGDTDVDLPAVPVVPPSDTATAARCLWSSQGATP